MIDRPSSNSTKNDYGFTFCSYCNLYPCEFVDEYQVYKSNHINSIDNIKSIMKKCMTPNYVPKKPTHLLYHQNKEYTPCPMKNGQYCVECGRKRVSEGIQEDYQIQLFVQYGKGYKIQKNTDNCWEPHQPVFISAQTGQGKNYFIENTLLPYVKNINYKKNVKYKILILSNRLALQQQIKNRTSTSNETEDGNKIYPYKDIIDVATYQSILLQKNYLKHTKSYLFVICDEAHFFTSDSMFNPDTRQILSAIIDLFQKSIRIYMSATPYECLKQIIDYERRYSKYIPLVFYHFKRNYDYLNTYTYSHIEELYDIIVKSINQKKKWLIFIDDRKKCASIKKALEEHGEKNGVPLIIDNNGSKIEKILTVDSNSKDDPKYQSMILNEKLNKDVYALISTSVLDNGINFTDIDNIVVSDMSRIKVLQMVGRARVSGDKDSKTLYIKRFNTVDVKNKINSIEQQKDAYHHYSCAYSTNYVELSQKRQYMYSFFEKYYNGDENDWKNAKKWFGRTKDDPEKLYLNEIAKSLLEEKLFQYQAIYTEMQKEQSQSEKDKCCVGQKYLEYQLSWFGKKYTRDHDITISGKLIAEKKFIDFLESYAINEVKIDNENQKDFKSRFTNLCDDAFGRKDRNKNRDYGINKMNSILKDENIDYKIESRTSHWIIIKYDWKQENIPNHAEQ